MALTKVTRATTLIKDGWGAFNTLIDDLLSVANGKGASQVGIEDTAGNMSAANVEDALAEIYTDHATTKTLAETFDENSATTTGLVWGYKGGLFRLDSTVTTVSAGTIALTDDATNYIEIDPSDGLVKKDTTSFTSGRIPIRTVLTASGSQTTSTDKRAWFSQVAGATTTTSGIMELATDAETITGTATDRVVTPANIVARAASVSGIASDPIWAAAGDLVQGTGNDTAAVLPLGVAALGVVNLKPVVNGTVNKLDVFTKSGGDAPDSTNYFTVAIPDGNGYTARTRKAAYLSGTSQFIMADATNYWSKGALAAEIKTAYVYAIWDAAGGIVWALGGYSGFTRVPASTTEGSDDFFLLEASSTYTKVITDYCVCVAKVRYEYDTGDAPDHTFQATALDAPQVCWNPKSDYGYQENLATSITQGTDITEASLVSLVVKQSGKYLIIGKVLGNGGGTTSTLSVWLKVGSATYGSAVSKSIDISWSASAGSYQNSKPIAECYLNAGDTIHLGVELTDNGGSRQVYGDNTFPGATSIIFNKTE
jgi:hypothetical protein